MRVTNIMREIAHFVEKAWHTHVERARAQQLRTQQALLQLVLPLLLQLHKLSFSFYRLYYYDIRPCVSRVSNAYYGIN